MTKRTSEQLFKSPKQLHNRSLIYFLGQQSERRSRRLVFSKGLVKVNAENRKTDLCMQNIMGLYAHLHNVFFFCQNILGYDYRSDIYSVGITAVELAYGVAPYKNIGATQVWLHFRFSYDIFLEISDCLGNLFKTFRKISLSYYDAVYFTIIDVYSSSLLQFIFLNVAMSSSS